MRAPQEPVAVIRTTKRDGLVIGAVSSSCLMHCNPAVPAANQLEKLHAWLRIWMTLCPIQSVRTATINSRRARTRISRRKSRENL